MTSTRLINKHPTFSELDFQWSPFFDLLICEHFNKLYYRINWTVLVRRVESIKSFLMDRFYVSYFRFSLVLWKCATILKFRMSSNSYDHLGKKPYYEWFNVVIRLFVILIQTIPPDQLIESLIWIVTILLRLIVKQFTGHLKRWTFYSCWNFWINLLFYSSPCAL